MGIMYIIALNYEQYKYHAKELGLDNNSSFVNGVEDLMGAELVKGQVIRVGEWFKREDITDIEKVLKAKGLDIKEE